MKRQLMYVLYSESTDSYYQTGAYYVGNGAEKVADAYSYDSQTSADRGLMGVNAYLKRLKNKPLTQQRFPDMEFINDFEVTPVEVRHI